MLAVVQNADAARLMGIDVTRTIALSYALSTALAGLAGLLIAPLFSVHSDMGTLFGIKAFAVAILGGIGSAPGVILAGLIYGMSEALITALFGSVYTQIAMFTVIIVALALMPQGLLGRAAGEEGLGGMVGMARRARHALGHRRPHARRGAHGHLRRRLHPVRAGAGRADDGGRRRSQHPRRPLRPVLHRPRRLLCHRRLCRSASSR